MKLHRHDGTLSCKNGKDRFCAESLNNLRNGKYEYFAYPHVKLNLRKLNEINSLSSANKIVKHFQGFMIPTEDSYRWHTANWVIVPFSYVYQKVEEFILLCHQNGIIDHLQEMLCVERSSKIEEQPKVLTLEMLSAGFYVWLASVVAAIFIFAIEHLHFFMYKNN